MLKRRRLSFAVAGISVLVLASAAAAAPNTFTATLTPTHVQPEKQAAYTLTLTNASTSAQAERAKVAIPAGFTAIGSVTANATAAANCAASTWEADGNLIADGKINLKRPGGGGNNNLCPGGTLTVAFSAVSPAAPGSYTWTPELLGEDEGDEEEPFTFTGDPTVHVDGTAPETTITSAPPAITNQTSAAFTFTSTDPSSSLECRLDGAAFEPCASPKTYAGLGAGVHTFEVLASDAAGNAGAASYGWRIDTAAPETTIASGPRTGTTAVSATFAFAATEPAAFECKLDGGAFSACTSPKAYSALARRAHTFEVRATDAAGNVDATPAAHRWTIAAARRKAKSTSALLSPRAGARVTSPPVLVWRRVARASYYNVQLYRGRTKVLSAWPTRSRFRLRARWTYRDRPRRLRPGTYRWYVWPHFGRTAAAGRYGRLLGQSTFTVARR